MIDSFVLIAYPSLAALRTLLQQLLVCLNFTLDSEDLFCWYKQKKQWLSNLLYKKLPFSKKVGLNQAASFDLLAAVDILE